MRNERESVLDARVRQLAEWADVDPDAVVKVVAQMVSEGSLHVPPSVELSPDAGARVSLARFRSAVPPPGDPAPGCPYGCDEHEVMLGCPIHNRAPEPSPDVVS